MSAMEGDGNCYCGVRYVTRTSWTDENPGRRFNTCARSRSGGCCFFAWVDPPMCDRGRVIIPGLLRNIRATEEQVTAMRNKLKTMFKWFIVSWIITLVCLFYMISSASEM